MANQVQEAEGLLRDQNSNEPGLRDGRETAREGSLQKCSPRAQPKGSAEKELKPGQRQSGPPPPGTGLKLESAALTAGSSTSSKLADTSL